MTHSPALDRSAEPDPDALDRARKKAYWRLLPLLVVCYAIAYVDRSNVAIAKLTMTKDLPGFDNAVIGFGAGVFFWGYFLLEVPGSILVERWSARKWISRIMITWGIMAALTAFVQCRIPGFTQLAELVLSGVVGLLRVLAGFDWGWAKDSVKQFEGPNGLTIFQFYSVRFLLGLAEAGFFPGIIVYLTHWFPLRDRSRALALFFIATPLAQMLSPKISNALLKLGTTEVVDGVSVHHAAWFGLSGWQSVYVFWGLPAVVLGLVVWLALKDRPRDAHWLTKEEREALEHALATEKAGRAGTRMTLFQALSHPKVLLLSLAYFCSVTGTQGLEFFLPSILEQWYHLKINAITWLVILPPTLALIGQLFIGWNSDRLKERRWHAALPLTTAAFALMLVPQTVGHLPLTIVCFMFAAAGMKAYLPAFWALPSLFLTDTAAAGSIGLINSLGNLGGFFGPAVLGKVETLTGSFVGGIYYLGISVVLSAAIIVLLGLGRTVRSTR